MTKSSAACLFGFCFVGLLLVRGASLDVNFQETTFATAGSQVTSLAWAPDGSHRLFVTRKGGVIEIVKNGSVLATPFATVSPVHLNGESGLVGICFDPNFMSNGHVYCFVTVSSNEQQIVRYTALGDIGTNKTVILPGLPTIGQFHNGGGIGIGPDGKLYWAIGDLVIFAGAYGDLTSLGSKVGRANLDGSVPADNPFVDGPGGTNDYIWASGFRNPFKLAFQPATGALWVDVAGDLYEQIFLVNASDDTGWGDYENNQPAGYLAPVIKYRTGGVDTRNLVAGTGAVRSGNIVTFTTTTTNGFRQGEKITIAGVGDSSFNGDIYVASTPSATIFTAAQPGADATSGGGTATTLNMGNAVTGGCFYDSTGAPAEYRGNFLFGDFGSDRIMRATLSASNTVQTVDYFVTGSDGQIDITVGPDGALYYVEFAGEIHRLAYTNFASQQLIVTPMTVRMMEGGLTAINVRLATAPLSDVTVNFAPTSGSTDINVSAGESLTFTPANWSVPQTATLQASADADTAPETATLTVSATGIASEAVTVHVIESPTPRPVLGPISVGDGGINIGLFGLSGATYILEGNSNLISPWFPLGTNTLSGSFTNLLDTSASNSPMRFYRARVAP